MTLFIDLDNTICVNGDRFGHRQEAIPSPGVKQVLQRLRDAGHTVVVYTGRGWNEYTVTRQWLDQHELVYDAIHMGKPVADIWIDDRAMTFDGWDHVEQRLMERGVL